jgi:hypothetical protein
VAALALAGRGDLSLANALVNESPGDFRLSPEKANLRMAMQFSLTATGGFTPYDCAIVSGSGMLAEDRIYQAPKTIASEKFIEVNIRATDQAGYSDLATVQVFKPFYIAGGTAVTMRLPGSVTVEAAGGVTPYSWAVDGVAGPAGVNLYIYTPATNGTVSTHVVGVTDFLGNYKEATITVLPADGAPLTIFPVSAGVQVGGTVSFTTFGGKPTYRWEPASDLNPNTGTPVAFTAGAEGTHTVTLTESLGASVTATVVVTAAPISTLVLSPEAPTVIAVGTRSSSTRREGCRRIPIPAHLPDTSTTVVCTGNTMAGRKSASS